MAKLTALSANPFPKDSPKHIIARAILTGDEASASDFPALLGLGDGGRVGPRTIQSVIGELLDLGFTIRRTVVANRVSYQLVSRSEGKRGDLIVSQGTSAKASVAPAKAAAKKVAAGAKKAAPKPVAGKGGADAELVNARKKAVAKKAIAKKAATKVDTVDASPTSAPTRKTVIRKAS